MTDWVNERSKCSPASVFETLKAELESDVNARNGLLTRADGDSRFHFSVTDDGKRAIVSLHAKRIIKGEFKEIDEHVSVVIDGKVIACCGRDLKEKFRATLTLNEEGKCRLNINGGECETWRFRQKVLEELFFDFI